MQNIFFHAVSKVQHGSFTTTADLFAWIEQYVFALFPHSGVEYWSDLGATPTRLPEHIRHVACYVHSGGEGRRIRVALVDDSGVHQIAFAKSFAQLNECWTIAASITAALERILLYREVPDLVEMSTRIPRKRHFKWDADPSLKISVVRGATSLRVTADTGLLLESRTWSAADGWSAQNAKHAIEGRVKDWATVLSALDANFEVRAVQSAMTASSSGHQLTLAGLLQ